MVFTYQVGEMIRSEEELAELLEARNKTRFAKIIQQEADYLQVIMILFGAALIMLVLHFFLALDFYGVKLAQWSGDMVETTAKITAVEEYERRRMNTHERHNTFRHRHHRHDDTVVAYRTVAQTKDGIRLKFNDSGYQGDVGKEIHVRYNRNNPYAAYIVEYGLKTYFQFLPAFAVLAWSLFLWVVAFYIVIRGRRMHRILEQGPYLKVYKTGRIEERKERGSDGWYSVFTPYYEYLLPGGRILEFKGYPQYEKPEGENDNYRYEYRIYMINPEDPRDNRYILTETPY
jgi:hypothetical protein